MRVLTVVTNALLRLMRVEPKQELASAFTAEEVQSIVAESRREGLLEDEHGLLAGALELAERRASDVMVPWRDLVTLPSSCTPADVEQLVGRTGFSRFPVVEVRSDATGDPGGVVGETPDGGAGAGDGGSPAGVTDRDNSAAPGEVVGYLHLKDLLYADDGRYERPVPEKRVRALATVGADEELEDVLAAMQRTGAHLARVIDDAGRRSGVVFLEDVLEELVGEVTDATQHPDVRRSGMDRSVPTT
jgi:CBS domain containing-hemolysin-like protein